jgi:hypothetical protein
MATHATIRPADVRVQPNALVMSFLFTVIVLE